MTKIREQQTIKVETIESEMDKKGVKKVVSISITSSNGLRYQVTNRKNSKSRTKLYLTYKDKILLSGHINNSRCRADSFVGTEEHLLFKLSENELEEFLLTYKDVGTIYCNQTGSINYSCFWSNRKIHIITDEASTKMAMVEVADKHRRLNVMEKFVQYNSKMARTRTAESIDGTTSIFQLYSDRHHVAFTAIYDKKNQTGTFKFVNESPTIINKLTPTKYKVALNDCLMKWIINNPRSKFEDVVNEYGFTDDMTYKQVKKILAMIRI